MFEYDIKLIFIFGGLKSCPLWECFLLQTAYGYPSTYKSWEKWHTKNSEQFYLLGIISSNLITLINSMLFTIAV